MKGDWPRERPAIFLVLVLSAGLLLALNRLEYRGVVWDSGGVQAGEDIGRGYPLLYDYQDDIYWNDPAPWWRTMDPKCRRIGVLIDVVFAASVLFTASWHTAGIVAGLRRLGIIRPGR